MKHQIKMKKSQFRPVIAWIIGGFLFILLWVLIIGLLLIMSKKGNIIAQQRARRNRSRLRENYTTVAEGESLGITPAMHTEFEKMLYNKPGIDYPCKDSTTPIRSVQRIVKCFKDDHQSVLDGNCKETKPSAVTEIPLPLRDCPIRNVIGLCKIGGVIINSFCHNAGGKCEGDWCVRYTGGS